MAQRRRRAEQDEASRRSEARAPKGLDAALERVGDRWMLLIVDALLAGPRRFNELATEVEGIAPNILTSRLRRLESDGIVVSRPYSRRPLRFAYELTASGRELAGALRLLADWGGRSTGAAPAPHGGHLARSESARARDRLPPRSGTSLPRRRRRCGGRVSLARRTHGVG